jgi:hypothetical protein
VFGRKPVINFATPAGLGGRNTTVLLLAVNKERFTDDRRRRLTA